MKLQEKKLKARLLGEGYSWYDTGTFKSYQEATTFVCNEETRSDTVICCPEKIAYDNKWITEEELEERASLLEKNSYGQYLKKVLKR